MGQEGGARTLPGTLSALNITTGKKNQKTGFVEKLQVRILFPIFFSITSKYLCRKLENKTLQVPALRFSLCTTMASSTASTGSKPKRPELCEVKEGEEGEQ